MHTSADKEFSYKGDPNFFVSEYVAALKKAGIRVAVITNHNKFDRDDFKALAKAARKEEIFILPGLELSVKDGSNGIHVLVVFSNDWISNPENTNYVQSFLGVTFAGQANFENENGRSNHDLNDTIRELDEFNKDYFLICAHVEANNGLWGGLSGGRITEIGESEPFRQRCVAFQKVTTHDKRTQVKSWLSDWYPAEVEGCDCKSIADIGKGKQSPGGGPGPGPLAGQSTVTGPPSSICFWKIGTTLPAEPRTLPNRTDTNLVSLRDESACT